MYLNYYNLSCDPFSLSPDPDFLFLSPSHKEAIGSIIFCIENKLGFCLLTGEVGTGKTTVIRYYLTNCNREKVVPVYIFTPSLSFRELIEIILEELQEDSHHPGRENPVRTLHHSLLAHARAGRTVVLIIDEAQNIPGKTLEQLRMLSNFETGQKKLLQIILIGQPEFNDQLKAHSLRQLRQRIAIRAVVRPLTSAETRAYIDHRLSIADGDVSTIFSKKALKVICRHARGAPRMVNILCANSLIAGVGYGRQRIDQSIAREVVSDMDCSTRIGFTPVRFGLAAVAMLILGVASAYPVHNALMDLGILLQQKHTAPKSLFISSTPRTKILAASKLPKLSVQRKKTTPAPHDDTKPVPRPDQVSMALQEPPPSPESSAASPHTHASVCTTRVVRRGDYLTKMSLEIYGEATKDTLTRVRDANPQIKDPDLIFEGDTLRFPN